MAPASEIDRPFLLARVSRRVSLVRSCAVSSPVSPRVLRVLRCLVGVAKGSPLVIMVPGRPSTAAAFTGVPFRIACIIGLIPPRDVGVGMREGRGMNAIASHLVGDENFPGIDTDIRDGVGGSKER